MINYLFLLAALFSGFLIQGQNVVAGLQACYPLNGNADNGSIAGAAMNGTTFNVISTTGQYTSSGVGVYFQGNNNSRIELPASATLKSATVTVCFWFNADSIGNTQYLVMAPGNCTLDPIAYAVLLDDYGNDVYLTAVSQGTNCNSNKALLTKTFYKNTWYFVTVSFTPDDIYIWQGTDSETASTNAQNHLLTGNVILGGNNASSNAMPFKGKMDQVRFYDRLLLPSEMEVLSIYSDVECSNLIGIKELMLFNANAAFPNPCVDQLTVDSESSVATILDLTGRKIMSVLIAEEQNTIDVSALPSGLYILETINKTSKTNIQKINISRN